VVTWLVVVRMPGESYQGTLAALSEHEQSLRGQLHQDVSKLAGEIGVRCVPRYQSLQATEQYISAALTAAGYQVQRQESMVEGRSCANLVVELPGRDRAQEIVIIGAHYDTVPSSPGADDNASAVAGLLALARSLADKQFSRTVRLVAFVNEEPPYFQTERMGSLVHARAAQAKGDKIVAALILEMLGYYTDQENSQHYPAPLRYFCPSVGNFIAFVGNIDSRALVHQVIASFRKHTKFPSAGAAAPAAIPGIGFSDHWSFWQIGVPAVMVTDTAFFRNPHYHQASDTPDRLDYDHMARVVAGLEKVIAELAEAR